MIFAWNDWNVGHIAEHGVTRDEAEFVVKRARRPYPLVLDAEKRLVIGRSPKGRTLHVIFVLKSAEDVEPESVSFDLLDSVTDPRAVELVFVIHAMPASDKMKRQDRRRRKR